jgi:tRNA threonylcarbamoyl adenosine modification protein YeaZ
MKILAFDATAPLITVGLAQDGRPLGRWDAPAQRTRGNVLEMLIDRALDAAGWSRRHVDGLALVLGPGSLTATRIGWATAAGWAQAADVPLCGWPTVAVQTRYWVEARSSPSDRVWNGVDRLLCLIHHRGDEFYCYTLGPDMPAPRPEVVVLGRSHSPALSRALLVGPGVLGYRERWLDMLGSQAHLVEDAHAIVGGDTLAVWGHEALAAGHTLSLERSPLDYGLPPDFRRNTRP